MIRTLNVLANKNKAALSLFPFISLSASQSTLKTPAQWGQLQNDDDVSK